jgi:predicted acyl esterase
MSVYGDQTTAEIRDGMRVYWDVAVQADDGEVLRADVFAPIPDGRYPVILSYGPYGKGLAFQQGYTPQWEKMVRDHPDVEAGSTNKYQNWEVVDPEKWVPDGYVCVRVDSRGCGRSPGLVDPWSPRETKDLYDCIEWAAAQPWSNGKVGLNGISYYAMNQYQAAALQPPHLAAICAWEGASDWYREFSHHGGILSEFGGNWFGRQVQTVQYGLGENGPKSAVNGELVTGSETLKPEDLAENKIDLGAELRNRPVIDDFYRSRNPDWSRVTVPLLSAGNWGGQGLHLRGNLEAYANAASSQKWLEIHGEAHWEHFYTDYGIALQKKFLGHFLKGTDTGWAQQSKVQLQIRHVDGTFVPRAEDEWPLARTAWTRYYLDAAQMSLAPEPAPAAGTAEYAALGQGVTFLTAAMPQGVELTGPMAAKLFIESTTVDADLFLVVRVFDPDGHEVTFMGALDPNTPVSQGWLRASHRKLDPERTLPYRPYHPHETTEPITVGEIYELDIEIWPSCVMLPSGYRLALTVRGTDYQFDGELSPFARTFYYANRGVGPFTHNDPIDRPADLFGGQIRLHTGGQHSSYLLLPVIPAG